MDPTAKTIADWKADPANWYAIEYQGTRYHYSGAEMDALWRVVECTRRRLESLRMVREGKARSMMDAYKIMGYAYGA
jgi:hypothetical protein